MKGVSKELKSAMFEINKIIKEYDINATIILADGNGHGEFKVFHDEPTWSQIRFIPRKDGSVAVHTKAYMNSKPKETNRTINSMYCIQDLLGRIYLMNDNILKDIESKIEIEKDKGVIIPGNFENK